MDELELSYDAEDDIPEAYRTLYQEREGKWVFSAIKGLSTNSQTPALEASLRRERAKTKELEKRLAPFKDLDPEQVQEALAELDELRVFKETAGEKGSDPAKVQSLIDAAVKRATLGLERKNQALTDQLQEAQGQVGELRGTITRTKVMDAARAAAGKAKVVPEAIEDVLVYAERLFEVTEDGNVVARDGVGVTPGIGIEDWLNDRSKDRPHWFPRSTGGGGRGSDGRPLGNNPWAKGSWSLTEQGKVMRERGQAAAEQLAKAAGSRIGATNPPA